jgi:hypothetical protein
MGYTISVFWGNSDRWAFWITSPEGANIFGSGSSVKEAQDAADQIIDADLARKAAAAHA